MTSPRVCAPPCWNSVTRRRNTSPGHQGVAQRGVPVHHLDAEPTGDGLEGVLVVVGVDRSVEQQRVQDRLGEADAGSLLLES